MTSDTTKYQGWTNYATWRVQLEMVNGQTCEDFGVIPEEGERLPDMACLEDCLETSCYEIIEMDATGLARDYALSFLGEVNWRELAEHMIDDYAATLRTR
jgi:hypothetical protein